MLLRVLYFIVIIIFINTYSVIAQYSPMKYGSIDKKDIEMEIYEKDIHAEAVVLCDYGKSYFEINKDGYFVLIFEKHTRIKVLNRKGLKWGNVSIPIYNTKTKREKIDYLKGLTFNLEDGKIIKNKLKISEGSFSNDINSNWQTRKFTMPNVKVGSVIEYSYRIKTPFFFNFRSWDFQSSIPTIWSEYNALLDHRFEYKLLTQGFEDFHTKEQTKEQYYRWVMKDVPAILPEKYITTLDDYKAKIEFELSKFQNLGEKPQIYLGSWESSINDLLDDNNFGNRLKPNNKIKDLAIQLTLNTSNKLEVANRIYTFVQTNFEWNGLNRMYGTKYQTNKDLLKSKSGSSADINLFLIALLKEAGINAEPVILSTRSHGKVHDSYPIINRFNYVICHFDIDDRTYLLDASNKALSFGMIPPKCVNGKGKIISDLSSWVSLEKEAKSYKAISLNLTFSNNVLKGEISKLEKGYTALNDRVLFSEGGNEKLISNDLKVLGNAKIDSFAVENLNSKELPLKIFYEFETDNYIDVTDDRIYLNPMIGHGINENPFNSDTRRFPIDYGSKINNTFVLNFKIPNGFQIESKPENLNISLPERTGNFRYNVNIVGDNLQLITKFKISNTSFLPSGYKYLKEFYAQMIAKHSEQIVLKKIN